MSYSGSGGGANALSSAADVALSAPQQAQVLGYNAAVQKWQNFPGPSLLIENVFVNTNSGSSETIQDVANYTVTALTLTADCALTFPSAARGKSFTVVLTQDATGSRNAAWPTSVKWPGGVAPSLSTAASSTDVFSFMCIDGVNWLGFVAGKAF